MKEAITKDYMLYDSICMKCSEQAKSTETENRFNGCITLRERVEGKWEEVTLNDYRISL